MLREGAAFIAALLLMSGVSAVIVPPPTNVTVSCRNLKVTVGWEYSKQRPETSFRVNIHGADGHSESRTTDHHYDLTPFMWASEKHYMDNFVVTVQAVRGSNQSEPRESKTFTFNNLKTTDIRCKLDFPPVDLNPEDSGASVSFRNPFHFYRELKQATKSDIASFKFTVKSEGAAVDGDCRVREENCRSHVSFPPDVKKCVTLTGLLHDGNVGQVVFRETGSICVPKSTEVYVITLAVLLSITILVIAMIIIIVCVAKAWTMEKVSLPHSLQPDDKGPHYTYDPDSNVDICSVTVKPSGGFKDENNPTTNLLDSSLSESSSQSLEAGELITEGHGRDTGDDDSADDSGATDCVLMDLNEEEEEEVSPYDCPHNFQVDMGDGDMITAYT